MRFGHNPNERSSDHVPSHESVGSVRPPGGRYPHVDAWGCSIAEVLGTCDSSEHEAIRGGLPMVSLELLGVILDWSWVR